MRITWTESRNSSDSVPLDKGTSTTASSLLIPVRHEAEMLIKVYWQTDTLERLVKTVHQSDRIGSLADPYPLMPRAFGRLARHRQAEVTYHVVQALTTEEESFVLLQTSRDSWRIDGDTQVVYNPFSWAFMIEPPARTLSRFVCVQHAGLTITISIATAGIISVWNCGSRREMVSSTAILVRTRCSPNP